MTASVDESFTRFVEAIRKIVAPFARMTDAELAAQNLDPPVVKLLLGLRENLRDYDAEGGD